MFSSTLILSRDHPFDKRFHPKSFSMINLHYDAPHLITFHLTRSLCRFYILECTSATLSLPAYEHFPLLNENKKVFVSSSCFSYFFWMVRICFAFISLCCAVVECVRNKDCHEVKGVFAFELIKLFMLFYEVLLY